MSGYVRVPPDEGGIDWRNPVYTREELRQLNDRDGTARLVLQGCYAYVKAGCSWVPFLDAGLDPNGAPTPIHLSAVDRLAELVDVPARPE